MSLMPFRINTNCSCKPILAVCGHNNQNGSSIIGKDHTGVIFRIPIDPVELPLMTSLWSVTLILVVYASFVLKFGRDWMEHRKPYNVTKAMLIYNIFQVIFNGALFLCIVDFLFIKKLYNWRCIENLPSNHPQKNYERILSYAFFINKVCDLTDTIFFVLRKSYKQITVLHVFHHIAMVIFFPLFYPRFGPGGEFSITALCNTLVHSIMYLYYFISALLPNHPGIHKWKKFITISQMVQFVIIHLHVDIMFIVNPECKLYEQHLVQFGMATTMFIMFSNFYYNCYIKPKSEKLK